MRQHGGGVGRFVLPVCNKRAINDRPYRRYYNSPEAKKTKNSAKPKKTARRAKTLLYLRPSHKNIKSRKEK